jgi:hypothetical protein
MARCAERRSRKGPFLRCFADFGDKLLNTVRRNLGRYHEHHRGFADARDRSKVVERIIGCVLQHLPRHHMGSGREQQRRAVGLGVLDGVAADGAACATPIVDDDRQSVLLPQLLGDQPGEHVDAAACCKRHDDPNGPIAELLRLGDRRRCEKRGRGNRQRRQNELATSDADAGRARPRAIDMRSHGLSSLLLLFRRSGIRSAVCCNVLCYAARDRVSGTRPASRSACAISTSAPGSSGSRGDRTVACSRIPRATRPCLSATVPSMCEPR